MKLLCKIWGDHYTEDDCLIEIYKDDHEELWKAKPELYKQLKEQNLLQPARLFYLEDGKVSEYKDEDNDKELQEFLELIRNKKNKENSK